MARPVIPRSLRARLFALWVLLLASAAATGYLLFEFYSQSADVQVGQAEVAVARACREIADRTAFVTGAMAATRAVDAGLRADLSDAVNVALARSPGVEGGIWTAAEGSVAYAYPTYEGTGPKTDLPVAERDSIAQINADALRTERPAALRRPSRTQALLLQACPLRGPIAGATAWTMARIQTDHGPAYRQLLAGFAFLAVTVLGSALFLGRFLYGFSGHIARLKAQLATPRSGPGDLPDLAPTGEPELDRLVEALNAAGARLREAQGRAVAAEKLAAVGRLSASVAHEIRNPLSAMRLKAENALASTDPARARGAIAAVLEQVARIDGLLSDLLGLTQARPPARAPADVAGLLEASARLHEDLAREQSVRLAVETDGLPSGVPVSIDAGQIARALDNLVLNALQHVPEGGLVRLAAARTVGAGGARLLLTVSDTGPGVPAAIRAQPFEPFATGRPDGTGLGLAIVREIARAHDGEVRLVESTVGATFEIDLPWL